MIGAASEEALSVLWKSHNSVHAHIIADFNAFLPTVRMKLRGAITKIHVSFNGWTTYNNCHALTGIYVHYLDDTRRIVDYMLALPKQLRKHSSVNYIAVLNNILKQFGITSERLGYFITNNAINNDACIRELSTTYTFNKKDKRI